MPTNKNETSTTGLTTNVASALCYVPVVGFFASLLFLFLEKNPQVKWHAVQALILAVILVVINALLGATLILAILIPLVNVGGLILSLVLAVKTYQGETMRLPYLGNFTDKVIRGAKN